VDTAKSVSLSEGSNRDPLKRNLSSKHLDTFFSPLSIAPGERHLRGWKTLAVPAWDVTISLSVNLEHIEFVRSSVFSGFYHTPQSEESSAWKNVSRRIKTEIDFEASRYIFSPTPLSFKPNRNEGWNITLAMPVWELTTIGNWEKFISKQKAGIAYSFLDMYTFCDFLYMSPSICIETGHFRTLLGWAKLPCDACFTISAYMGRPMIIS